METSLGFVHFSAAELTSLRTKYLACLEAIAVAGASYSIGSRTFTRANLDDVVRILGAITAAQKMQSGELTQITYAKLDG